MKQFIFHRTKKHDPAPEIIVKDDKLFEDAIFEFVYNDLGYTMLEVDSEDGIEVKEV